MLPKHNISFFVNDIIFGPNWCIILGHLGQKKSGSRFVPAQLFYEPWCIIIGYWNIYCNALSYKCIIMMHYQPWYKYRSAFQQDGPQWAVEGDNICSMKRDTEILIWDVIVWP